MSPAMRFANAPFRLLKRNSLQSEYTSWPKVFGPDALQTAPMRRRSSMSRSKRLVAFSTFASFSLAAPSFTNVYAITDLGVSGTTSAGHAVNNLVQVTGAIYPTGCCDASPTVWNGSLPTTLGNLPGLCAPPLRSNMPRREHYTVKVPGGDAIHRGDCILGYTLEQQRWNTREHVIGYPRR